jgi:hypothetical protein
VNASLSKDVDIVILKSMKKRPEDRYRDSGEFLADFDKLPLS